VKFISHSSQFQYESVFGGMQIRKEIFPISANEAFQASLDCVKKLGWEIIKQNPDLGEINAKTGATLRSWGENISIRAIADRPSQTTITVASDAPFQLFDWGKSSENEKLFLDQLRKTISR